MKDTRTPHSIEERVSNSQEYLSTLQEIFLSEKDNPNWPLGSEITPDDIKGGIHDCNEIYKQAGMSTVSVNEITCGRLC